MGRGRPRKETQRNREEGITQGIASSSSAVTTQGIEKITKPQFQTPAGAPIGIGKEKVTPTKDEQWPELAKRSGSGTGQANMEGNGVVTLTTPSISPQRKIELNGVAAAKPWANLFSTNRLGTFIIKPVILYHKDGYFVVRFANEGERDMVLEKRLTQDKKK
ncbi:hypothetical protein RDI58_001325 [Solanum bulbocastanum]|uniref:Uncharacterized protein n=1 Tax=Solanum bulbocastanum TaxID=147425 RepID=A0AAN8UE61_SOLBU